MQENQYVNVIMYDPKIYPRKLWVATSLEGLNGKFTFTTMDDHSVEQVGEYEDLVKITKNSSANMTTGAVIEKGSDLLGVLVVIHDTKETATKTIAHEAVHVADYFYQELGMYTQEFRHTNEAYAYLVGWIAGCIENAVLLYTDDEKSEKVKETNKVW